jgi:signal transduction histidine kinase
MAGRDAGEAHHPKGRRRTSRLLNNSEKWQPRNWRLRTKMTVVVAVPALTALAFAGLRIQTELAAADDYDRIVSQVDASMLITEVVHQLQDERGLVAAAVADGSIGSNQGVQNQIRRTDSAISELRAKIGSLELTDPDSKARYNSAFNKLGQLTPLRNLAAQATYPDLAVVDAYDALVDPLVQLGREITTAGNATGQSPSRLGAAVQSIGQAKERASQLDALLMVSAVRNSFRSANVQNQASAASAGFDSSIADFLATATPDEQQKFNDGYSGADVDRRKGIAQAALLSPDPTAPLDIDLATLRKASIAANNKLRGVETDLIASLRSQASGLASGATATAWQVALIVVAAMLIALVLMLAMAQSLVNPLRRLRRGALRVANVTLPKTIDRILADANPVEAAKNAVAPMPVDTSEEIGQVARSFDVVHERAVRLATEQAVLRDNVNDMFVNLSRRSQALVERQLAELDKLEQTEQDPDQLARFFVLDHLAARMRRNSENLLILSGVGVARRSSKPVSITEVIGAAQSEIESYARVVVKQGPATFVQGRVVNDVAHLLAELLDNATKFSSEDTEVSVTTAHVRSGELAIQISDKGLGLSDEELTDINRRLVDPPPFDLAVSRRMGLYVVARLAKRHDIKVRLHGEFNSGTSAVVVLPKKLAASSDPSSGSPSTAGTVDLRGRKAMPPPPQSEDRTEVHTGPQSRTTTGPNSGQNPVVGPPSGPQPVSPGLQSGRFPAVGPNSGPNPVVGPPSGPQPVSPALQSGRFPAVGPNTGPNPAAGTQPVSPATQSGHFPAVGPNSGPNPVVGPGTGPNPIVRTGPHTGPNPVIRTGPNTGPQPIPPGAQTGQHPIVRTGPNTGPQPIPPGAQTGQHPAIRTGPDTGPQPVPRAAQTGQHPIVRTGPNTGPQPIPPGAQTGQHPIVRTGPNTGPQPIPPGTRSGHHPAVGQGTGQHPAVSPPARPPSGNRSAWFQRTVPASAQQGARNGKGNGKGNGNAKGGTAKGNGRGKRPKADPKAVPSSSLNWATTGEDGWSAVRRKLGETMQQGKVNDEGPLPHRTPGSRLVPGSFGGQEDGDGLTEAMPPQREADRVRSKLSGYQQGLARARGENAGEPPREQE